MTGGPHEDADERPEQVGAHCQSRSLGDVVDAGTQLEATSWTHDAREQIGERLAGAFDARRHHPGGDDGCLEQAEVIFGEVKDLSQGGDVRGRSEVHRGEAEHRFIEHAQPGADRRAGRCIASVDTEVNGDVQHLGSLGIVHAQEEDVGPGRMGEVHPHRCLLPKNRIAAVG